MMTRIARIFFKMYSSAFSRHYLLNRDAKWHQQKNALPMGAGGERIAQDLKKDGIAITTLDELFPGKNVLSHLLEYTEKRIASAESKTAKTFLRQLWDATPAFSSDDPFIRFAMEDRILAIVNAYLAMYAKLYYFTLNVTTPMASGSIPIQSQRWHRDPEDRNMCKVFLYLNDVDETAGPFVYIRGSQYGGEYGNFFPQDPPRGSHPTDDEVVHAIPKEAMMTATGKAGTVIFCDTAGIHKGGYATKNQRLMFTAGYCTPSSPWPLRYTLTDRAHNEIKKMKLSDPVRYALDGRVPKVPLYFLKKIKKNFIEYG